MAKFLHILTDILVAHTPLIQSVEIGIEGYQHLLIGEILPTERNVLIQTLLLTQILKLLTMEKMQIKIAHIGCECQASRIG